MIDQARVVIIGGGIAGCGILYHLAKLGWTDALIVEKAELTAGATWHAAGNLSHYASSAFWTRVQKATTDLYEELAAECGHDVGFRKAGSIRLATIPDHEIENARAAAKAKALGVEMHIIGRSEIQALFPFAELDGVLSGAFTPGCGSADPSSITYAMATRARAMGARIRQGCKVLGLAPTLGGEWRIQTDKGEIAAEIVVNAGGMWAPEIAAMVGVSLPFVIFLHQHLVTESSPKIAALPRPLPTLRDPIGGFNVRQEGIGLLSGVYEHEPEFWGVDGVPPDFGREVLPPHWERSQDFLDNAIRRVPLLGELGIKMVYNAPTSRTPDHAPLVGPVPGLRNFFMAAGFAAGIMQSATTRLAAEWVAHGEPSLDPAPIDVRRYGAYATKEFTYAVVRAGHKFAGAVDYPHGERQSARPSKTSPLYPRHRARNAVLGARNGWEVPLWFAPEGMTPKEEAGFGRPSWWPHAAAEARATKSAAGLFDATSWSRFEAPAAAESALRRACMGDLPALGHAALLPLLHKSGRLAAVLTVTRLGDRFVLAGPAETGERDHDVLWRALGGAVADVTERTGTLVVLGPHAPDILGAAAPAQGAVRQVVLGAPCLAVRLPHAGLDAFHLIHALDAQHAVYEHVMKRGEAMGLREIGQRALDMLALESGMPRWRFDLEETLLPGEAGFGGPAAARRIVRLAIEPGDGDPYLNDTVFDGEVAVGLVGSGGADSDGRCIALALLPAAHAKQGKALHVQILGVRRAAMVEGLVSLAAEDGRLAAQ
jgi:dimethylglycine dehydrogenase